MTHPSPLDKLTATLPKIDFGDGSDAAVVATFGELEAEYAAIRKGCILIDLPQRATVIVRGGDRLDFLNRMLTQELRPRGQWIAPWSTTRSFWLNRKGRIDADLRCIELPTGVLCDAPCMAFDVDVLSAPVMLETLASFIIMEDVQLEDATLSMHRLALHGPSAAALLADCSIPDPGAADLRTLQRGQATRLTIAQAKVVVDRQDSTGEIGLELLVPAHAAEVVWRTIAQRARTDFGHLNDVSTNAHRLRLAGWHAYNIARIEAGWPLLHVDFSRTNLPAETGVLDDRVSFTKGCYLGQEVVARMKSLGHPKQTLIALRLDSADQAHQPDAGAALRTADDASEPIVGGITSSARSPMLSDAIICFAQVKWGHHEPGSTLYVQTPVGHIRAIAQKQLAFWSRS